MNSANDLKSDIGTSDIGTEETPAPHLLGSIKTGDADTSDKHLVQIDRQYVPSETLQLGNDRKSPQGSSFRKLGRIFRINSGPSLPRSQATIDLLVTIFCFSIIHFTYLGSLEFTSPRTIALLSSLALILTCLSAGGLYSRTRPRTLVYELSNLLLCWMCSFALVGLFAFLTKTAGNVSRVWITTSMVLSFACLAGIRVLSSLDILSRNKVRARTVVICGNAPNIKPVMRSLYKESDSRIRVAKIFEFSTEQTGNERASISLESPAEQITRFVESQRQSGTAIEQVWIAVQADQSQVVEKLSETLINSSVDVCVVPDQYTGRLLEGDSNTFGNTKVVNISEISLSPAANQFKRVFDIIVTLGAILAFCIPMTIIAALIKFESPGPVLFRQKRYGVDGKEIEILKFRSMLVHSDDQVTQATRNDARVTRIGKMLRSTSLDELPQLLNVLSGTMSLVGPRPHAVAHNEIWRHQIKGYMLRHKVRPGITGWAQVHGWRGETDTSFKMQQRVNHDLEYIRNWSPWLDIRILFLTVAVGFRAENAY